MNMFDKHFNTKGHIKITVLYRKKFANLFLGWTIYRSSSKNPGASYIVPYSIKFANNFSKLTHKILMVYYLGPHPKGRVRNGWMTSLWKVQKIFGKSRLASAMHLRHNSYLQYCTVFWASNMLLNSALQRHLKQRKFETNIPRNETARPQSQFLHSTLCELKYIPWSVCLVCCRKINGPIVGIFKSLTETWMWKLGLRLSSFFSGRT